MGCLTGMVRTIMFVFNFACLAVGIVLMAVGGFFYVAVDKYYELIDGTTGLNVVPSLTIAVGVIVFVIAFLGCCGALRNSSCMLMTYAIILIVMLIIQFAGGIYGIVHMKNNDEEIQGELKTAMRKAFKKYDSDKTITDLFDSMQSEIKCCGVDGPADYQLIHNYLPTIFPGSCCGKPNDKTCTFLTSETKFEAGCGSKLYEDIESSIQVVGIVALSICAVELLGAIFAICLVKSK